MSNVPHNEIERPAGEEALMRGVVLFLSSKIPRHKRDALERGLGHSDPSVVRPITDNNTYCAKVSRDIIHSVCVCVRVCVRGTCVCVCVCVCVRVFPNNN